MQDILFRVPKIFRCLIRLRLRSQRSQRDQTFRFRISDARSLSVFATGEKCSANAEPNKLNVLHIYLIIPPSSSLVTYE
jgi:hypothetical protein